ncbi:tyrosyl-tRNA synthetase [Rhizoclosmatium hyalinum]|nr:tyrosyl-tRNA synthetase [Rhizoclosmatium hyalinum]
MLFKRFYSSSPIDTLRWRGLLHQVTRPTIDAHLSKQPTSVYAGFDPTARSLHVGNLLTIVALMHFAARGHSPIALIGGATAAIGDPSGRASERSVLARDVIIDNSSAIRTQLSSLFKNAVHTMARHSHPTSDALLNVKVLDNYDWFHRFSLIDFMGTVGRFARVSQMLAKESVKSRLEAPDGISFTEFTYQLLQGYDFQYLNKTHNVSVQIGGSDQWGNITSGIDLIRKMREGGGGGGGDVENSEDVAFGLTFPLVTTASGEKFGKSAGNAIWMDPAMVSPFDFYQFFRRTPDSEVERYLKYFTFMSEETIAGLMKKHQEQPHLHTPQRTLAFEVTHLVHGEESAKNSKTKSHLLYDAGDQSTPLPTASEITAAFKGDDRLVQLSRGAVLNGATTLLQVAVQCGSCKSISAAKKLVASGGLYINNVKVANGDDVLSESAHTMEGKIVLVRSGKSKYTIVQLI